MNGARDEAGDEVKMSVVDEEVGSKSRSSLRNDMKKHLRDQIRPSTVDDNLAAGNTESGSFPRTTVKKRFGTT